MADKPDFSKIWASESPLTPYSFADSDYLKGWSFIGEVPPDRRMFDALQRHNDEQLKWVSENASLNLRKPSTEYAVGDIAYSALLPSWAYIECTVGGTTSSSDLPVPRSGAGNDTFTDGTVTWVVCKIENMSNYTKTVNAPMFNKRDVITTSGTYTAPVTGWYKITVKGGGGGGGGARITTGSSTSYYGGGGGGEGGTTIVYASMTAGDTLSVVIGAGGTGGTGNVAVGSGNGADGGDTSVSYNGNIYTANGGKGGTNDRKAGTGGNGTISGCGGNCGPAAESAAEIGGTGGGAGGGNSVWLAVGSNGAQGGGGCGGSSQTGGVFAGSAGGDGYVWFEYFDSTLNA